MSFASLKIEHNISTNFHSIHPNIQYLKVPNVLFSIIFEKYVFKYLFCHIQKNSLVYDVYNTIFHVYEIFCILFGDIISPII